MTKSEMLHLRLLDPRFQELRNHDLHTTTVHEIGQPMDACRIGPSIIFQKSRGPVLTTYAVSPRFVIKESMGTGVLDSNFIPNIWKSFCNPDESEAYRKVSHLQVLLEKTEI